MKTKAYAEARGEKTSPQNAIMQLVDQGQEPTTDDEGIQLDAVTIRPDRKQPRSKMQRVVDNLEDTGNKMQKLNLAGFNAPRISSRIWDCDHLLALDISVRRAIPTHRFS